MLRVALSGSTVNVGGSAGHAPHNLVRDVTVLMMKIAMAVVVICMISTIPSRIS